MTVKERAMQDYTDRIIKYCEEHENCKGCVFETEPDINGDSCPFYVVPSYFNALFPEKHIATTVTKIELVEE
ncbi:hypothetical protein [Treponema sp.]|uniref:hypothetical protein n=1 Tax=Treponema sp. TaxID=166 RepID=UPI00388EF864